MPSVQVRCTLEAPELSPAGCGDSKAVPAGCHRTYMTPCRRHHSFHPVGSGPSEANPAIRMVDLKLMINQMLTVILISIKTDQIKCKEQQPSEDSRWECGDSHIHPVSSKALQICLSLSTSGPKIAKRDPNDRRGVICWLARAWKMADKFGRNYQKLLVCGCQFNATHCNEACMQTYANTLI